LVGTAAPVNDGWPYGDGPHIQAYGGMGVEGNSDPSAASINASFLGAPSGVDLRLHDNTLYVADARNNDIRNIGSDVNMKIANGEFNVTDADRPIMFTMGTIGGSVVDHETEDLYWTDLNSGTIIRYTNLTGKMEFVANADGERGEDGDCSASTLARLRSPRGLAILPQRWGRSKSLAVVDSGNNRVREIELTGWPGCVKIPEICVESVFINVTSGKLCTGRPCGFETPTPDKCAFECSIYQQDEFPAKYSYTDVVFTQTMVEQQFNGSNGFIDTNSSLADMMMYPVLATSGFTFNDGTTQRALNSGSFLLGVVRPMNTLRRLNRTEAADAVFLGNYVKFDFQTPPSVTLRFYEPGGLKCFRWSWEELSNPLTSGTRSGLCFLLPNSSSTVNGRDGCGVNSTATGNAACAPGRIRTLIGNLNKSSAPPPANPDSLPLESPVLETNLKGARDVVYYYREADVQDRTWSSPNPALLVSDTLHHRILALPLAYHPRYFVYFWVFLAGTSSMKVAKEMETTNLLTAVLPYGLMPPNETVSNATLRFQDLRMSERGTTQENECAMNGEVLKQQYYFESLRQQAGEICQRVICSGRLDNYTTARMMNGSGRLFEYFGYNSTDCCIRACEPCITDCIPQLAGIQAAFSSVDKCVALSKYQACLESSPKCRIGQINVPTCTFSTVAPIGSSGSSPTLSPTSAPTEACEDNTTAIAIHLKGQFQGFNWTTCAHITHLCQEPTVVQHFCNKSCMFCGEANISELDRVQGYFIDRAILSFNPTVMTNMNRTCRRMQECAGSSCRTNLDVCYNATETKCEAKNSRWSTVAWEPSISDQSKTTQPCFSCDTLIFQMLNTQNGSEGYILNGDGTEASKTEASTKTNPGTSALASEVIGVLISAELLTPDAASKMGQTLQYIKEEEIYVQQLESTSDGTTKGYIDTTFGYSRLGVHKLSKDYAGCPRQCATLKKFQEELQGGLEYAYGYDKSLDVRFSISSTTDYTAHRIENFLASEQRGPDLVHTVLRKEPEVVVDYPTAEGIIHPNGMTVDRDGRLYVSDISTERIVRVQDIWNPDYDKITVEQIAGTGYASFSGNGGLANQAALNKPGGLASGDDGVLYVGDTGNHQVRQVLGLTRNVACNKSRDYFQTIMSPSQEDNLELIRTIQCRLDELRILALTAIRNCERCSRDAGSCSGRNALLFKTQCQADRGFLRGPVNCQQFDREVFCPMKNCRWTSGKCEASSVNSRMTSQLAEMLVAEVPTCETCADSRFPASTESCNLEEIINVTWENKTCDRDGLPQWTVTRRSSDDPISDEDLPCATHLLQDTFVEQLHEAFTAGSSWFAHEDYWTLGKWDFNLSRIQIMRETPAPTPPPGTVNTAPLPKKAAAAATPAPSNVSNYTELLTLIRDTTTVTEVASFVSQAKARFCQRTGTVQYGFPGVLTIILWYNHVWQHCEQASLAAEIGATMYNTLNLIPLLLMRPTFNFTSNTLEPSVCHPGCNLIQANFFSMIRNEADIDTMIPDHCCGHLGYLCGFGEGHCHSDPECAGELSCVENACTWGPGKCCAMNRAGADSFMFSQASRFAVTALGFTTVIDQQEVSSNFS
jgi:hypothetical protein